jgi:hypothetical protein
MGDDWDKVRNQWRRLEESPLAPEEVFDALGQARIAHAIAQEAIRASGAIHRLKRSVYYRRQAADAQDHALRARSIADRDAWLRLAHNWLNLLNDAKAKETAPDLDHRDAPKQSH